MCGPPESLWHPIPGQKCSLARSPSPAHPAALGTAARSLPACASGSSSYQALAVPALPPCPPPCPPPVSMAMTIQEWALGLCPSPRARCPSPRPTAPRLLKPTSPTGQDPDGTQVYGHLAVCPGHVPPRAGRRGQGDGQGDGQGVRASDLWPAPRQQARRCSALPGALAPSPSQGER